MMPYARVPDLTLVPAHALNGSWPEHAIAVHPFGLLVALAIWVGVALTFQHARRESIPTGAVQSYLVWLLVSGFVGGHIVDRALYCSNCDMGDISAWLRLSEGQSSFGGFIGAGLGSWAWSIRHRASNAALAESVSSSFPAAWFFGRLGCAIAHDHPGRVSTIWFAVAYPGSPRLDMGLLEAAASLPLAIVFLSLRGKPRPSGFFLGVMCLYYAPIRFALDFARATDLASSDSRYAQLTPAQWGCIGLLGVGLIVLRGAFARSHA
jgi:phosphatidylglycerol:prolipoprotein diacylglycerol transferase